MAFRETLFPGEALAALDAEKLMLAVKYGPATRT